MMIPFNEFIHGLGEHGRTYSPTELRDLHADVHKLADILQAAIKTNRARRAHQLSTSTPVDEAYQDRTLEKKNAGLDATGQSAP